MNDRMQFSGPDLFNYFAKCLTMNALAEWHIDTPLAQEDCTKDSFLTAQQAWLESLLPHDAFLCQKELMNNTLKKPFTMKVQEFGNRLRVLNHLLDLFPHSGEDKNLTDGELKTLFLECNAFDMATGIYAQGNKSKRYIQGLGCLFHNISNHSRH